MLYKHQFDEKLIFKLSKLQGPPPTFDPTPAAGDSAVSRMKTDCPREPITPRTLSSSSSPERREAGAGSQGHPRQDGSKWLVSAMAADDGGKRRGDHREFTGPCSNPHLRAGHPWQTSTAKHPRERGSARGHGRGPTAGQSFPQSLCTHTHTHTHSPRSHSTCPLDLPIKTQEQISRLVTTAQKQMMPNT